MRYHFKLARTPSEQQGYFNLRRRIFCHEQGLFADSDIDGIDQRAQPIVAIANHSSEVGGGEAGHSLLGPLVVGVVRIYETEPHVWYGGRLGTHPHYRRGWQIGKGLIYQAVTTAHSWGCTRFLATVQSQNVRMFERFHWHSLEELSIFDRPHHLMMADLDYYPANGEARPETPKLPDIWTTARPWQAAS